MADGDVKDYAGEKKKPSIALVISVGPKMPKKPEDTSKPDGAMKKAWGFMKATLPIRPKTMEYETDPKRTRRYEQTGGIARRGRERMMDDFGAREFDASPYGPLAMGEEDIMDHDPGEGMYDALADEPEEEDEEFLGWEDLMALLPPIGTPLSDAEEQIRREAYRMYQEEKGGPQP
tara:strand:+ start:500 stop:1027 length:528 start_codon:yes stop_codon:yes gene_type:complete